MIDHRGVTLLGMSFFDTNHQRAAWLVALLGVGIFIALVPYASGLLGAPILFVVFGGVHEWLVPRVRSRALASSLVIVLAIVLIVVPLVWMVSLLVGQAQSAVQGVINSPVLDRISTLEIAGYPIGPDLKAAGAKAATFVGGGAISFLGTATRLTLNLLFTFFGLYYLLHGSEEGVARAPPVHPVLRRKRRDPAGALRRGDEEHHHRHRLLLGGAGYPDRARLQVTGLGNAVFWGVVTVVFSILPVVGGGLIWGPGRHSTSTPPGDPARRSASSSLARIVVGNVDNLIRPMISNRYAQIHPLITLVGAIAGVSYIGLLGLLVGPLALSYFFELLTMYRREYLRPVVVR